MFQSAGHYLFLKWCLPGGDRILVENFFSNLLTYHFKFKQLSVTRSTTEIGTFFNIVVSLLYAYLLVFISIPKAGKILTCTVK